MKRLAKKKQSNRLNEAGYNRPKPSYKHRTAEKELQVDNEDRDGFVSIHEIDGAFRIITGGGTSVSLGSLFARRSFDSIEEAEKYATIVIKAWSNLLDKYYKK